MRCNSCGQMPKSLVVLCWFHQSEVSGGACTAAPINAAGLQTSALQHAITTPVDTILSHLSVNNDILPGTWLHGASARTPASDRRERWRGSENIFIYFMIYYKSKYIIDLYIFIFLLVKISGSMLPGVIWWTGTHRPCPPRNPSHEQEASWAWPQQASWPPLASSRHPSSPAAVKYD